jgi:hypothetical protein
MKNAVLFANTGVLDFLELRTSIVRIPEVIAKLKEAQVYLDRAMDNAPDLIQFLTSEDQVFWRSEKIRKIAVAVVQLALYERYAKRFGEASHVLSVSNEDSPIQVLSGNMRLGEFIINLAMKEEKVKTVENLNSLPEPTSLAKGISMPDFQLYEKSEEQAYKLSGEGEKEALNELLMKLRDEEGVKQFVNVGPGQSISGSAMSELVDKELNIMESIDLDPMLSWFWDVSSNYSYQLAN